jgi:hypothetical protein
MSSSFLVRKIPLSKIVASGFGVGGASARELSGMRAEFGMEHRGMERENSTPGNVASELSARPTAGQTQG